MRFTQELDNLLEFFFGLFHAGHVLERDLLLLRGVQAGAALAETERFVAAALHLPHHENPEGDEHDEGRGIQQDRDPVARAGVFDLDIDTFVLEELVNIRVVSGDQSVKALVGILVRAMHVIATDGDVFHLTLLHLVHEIGEGDRIFFAALTVPYDGE